jgi:hypothetical protein
MEALGRSLVLLGLTITVIGGVVWGAARLGLPLGRLPGDIRIERDGFHFYFPLGTCLLVSVVLSGVVWLIHRLR